MTNEPNHNKFLRDFMTCLVIALIMVILCIIFSSCKFIHEMTKGKKETSSDSVSVKKETEEKSNGETIKSKSENTKETVYYPQPIIVPGKDGSTQVVFVPQSTKETGKQESETSIFEQWKRNFQDSLQMVELTKSKDKDSKTTIKTDWMTIGILALLGFILIKDYLPFKILRK